MAGTDRVNNTSDHFQRESHTIIRRADTLLDQYNRLFGCLRNGHMDLDDRAPCLAVTDWMNSTMHSICGAHGMSPAECENRTSKIVSEYTNVNVAMKKNVSGVVNGVVNSSESYQSKSFNNRVSSVH